MKFLFLPFICVGAMGLTSCGLLRTATQIPGSLLQTVGRTAGFGLEHSEVKQAEKVDEQVKFEQVAQEPK